MPKFNFDTVMIVFISFLALTFLIKFSFPALSNTTNDFKNLAPYSSYTYTSYSNISNVIANSSQNASALKTISVASNSDISKTETLSIKITNAGLVDITARLYFNGAFIENMTSHNNTSDSYLLIPIGCINGVNTIEVNTWSSGNNVTYANSTLSCATTLNGTDYSYILTIVLLSIGLFVALVILLASLKHIK